MLFDELLKYSMVLSISNEQLKYFYSELAKYSSIQPIVFNGFNLIKSKLYNSCGCGARNCTFGHLAMIKYAQLNNWPYIMIFEDDAILDKTKYAFLKEAITNIDAAFTTYILGYNPTTHIKIMKNINTYFNSIKTDDSHTYNISGSHAYLILKNGFQNRINMLEYYGVADSYSFNMDKKLCILNYSAFLQKRVDFNNSIHNITI